MMLVLPPFSAVFCPTANYSTCTTLSMSLGIIQIKQFCNCFKCSHLINWKAYAFRILKLLERLLKKKISWLKQSPALRRVKSLLCRSISITMTKPSVKATSFIRSPWTSCIQSHCRSSFCAIYQWLTKHRETWSSSLRKTLNLKTSSWSTVRCCQWT